MAVPSPVGRRPTVGALITLTAVTGLIDALCFLRLGHIFVANMTGNIVFLGLSLDTSSGLSAVAALVAISGFLIGALGGGRLAHGGYEPRRWLVTAFGAQAALLALVAVLTGSGVLPFDGHGRYFTIVFLGIALGLQNATVRTFGVADLTTIVLTGTLTGLADDSKLAHGSGTKPHRRIGSLVAMLVGAGAGALLVQSSASSVIAIAAVLVGVVTAVFARSSAGSGVHS